MPLNRVSEELRAQKHADDLRRHRKAAHGRAPRIVNARPVLWLTDPVRWPFRGRMYEVPPISFRDGVRCMEFQQWAWTIVERGVSDGYAEEYRKHMGSALRLIRRCVIPERGPVRRLLWRLRLWPNPWKTATDSEVSELVGFFCARRTISPDRLVEGAPVPSTS